MVSSSAMLSAVGFLGLPGAAAVQIQGQGDKGSSAKLDTVSSPADQVREVRSTSVPADDERYRLMENKEGKLVVHTIDAHTRQWVPVLKDQHQHYKKVHGHVYFVNAEGQWEAIHPAHQQLVDHPRDDIPVHDPDHRCDQRGHHSGLFQDPSFDVNSPDHFRPEDYEAYEMVQQAKRDLRDNKYFHIKGADMKKIIMLYGGSEADIEMMKQFHYDITPDPTKFYRQMSTMGYEFDYDRGIIDRKRRTPLILGGGDGYAGENVGRERWLGDIADWKCRNTAQQAIMKFQADVIKAVPTKPKPGCDPNGYWLNNNYYARTTTAEGLQGEPASEGVHQDGTQYVMTMMLEKDNWSGENSPKTGVTTLDMPSGLSWAEAHSDEYKQHILFEGKHEDFLDMFMIQDSTVKHVLSDLYQDDPTKPAYRGMFISITRQNAVKGGVYNPETGKNDVHSMHNYDSHQQHPTMPLTFEMRARKVLALDHIAKQQEMAE